MSIEIRQPQLEALIQQRMASGNFRDVDELLTRALGALEGSPSAPTTDRTARSLYELSEPVRGLLTDEEVDVLFQRGPSMGRPLDLS